MKLVVFSDIHGNKMILERILSFNPDSDYFISLGDTEVSHDYLENLDILAVKGNYPRDPGFDYEGELEVEGRRIFFTHGHKYKIRNGIKKLFQKGMSGNYDLVLYGHTHIPEVNVINGVTLVNPGSANAQRIDRNPTYVIIYIEKEKEMKIEYRESHTNLVVEGI
jgi:putative phosphoesterase